MSQIITRHHSNYKDNVDIMEGKVGMRIEICGAYLVSAHMKHICVEHRKHLVVYLSK